MPNWCDKHKRHTIDEVCPGCERDTQNPERVIGMLLVHMDEAILACLQGHRPSIVNLVEGAIAAGTLYDHKGADFVEKWKRILDDEKLRQSE